jgi:hypothetical protein
VTIRMRNERQPEKTLNLAHYAWSELLELALDYGWNPMGAVVPGRWHLESSMESYYPGSDSNGSGSDRSGGDLQKQVLFEDALNLADALEQAFLDYEPVRVPASYYVFEPEDPMLRRRPGIGAMAALIDFCRQGSFWLESLRQRQDIAPLAAD